MTLSPANGRFCIPTQKNRLRNLPNAVDVESRRETSSCHHAIHQWRPLWRELELRPWVRSLRVYRRMVLVCSQMCSLCLAARRNMERRGGARSGMPENSLMDGRKETTRDEHESLKGLHRSRWYSSRIQDDTCAHARYLHSTPRNADAIPNMFSGTPNRCTQAKTYCFVSSGGYLHSTHSSSAGPKNSSSSSSAAAGRWVWAIRC